MSNFKNILEELKKHLENVQYKDGDLSDVGNEIGIVLGNYIENEQEFKELVTGIRHGISLTNGTH